jgi:hypothetical protein
MGWGSVMGHWALSSMLHALKIINWVLISSPLFVIIHACNNAHLVHIIYNNFMDKSYPLNSFGKVEYQKMNSWVELTAW